MKAPFPYFGGKSRIADVVWRALGNPGHYMEPFFGSGAVLLARPDWKPGMTETVCDADGNIANVWRALQFAPDEVARWCDWPVNHADLMARKAEIIRNGDRLLENLVANPKWFDATIAGYWIWAASCWIGSGMMNPNFEKRPHLYSKGVHCQIPHIGHNGKGVNAVSANNINDWFQELSSRLRHVRVVCGDWSRICGGDWQDKAWKNVGIFFDPPYGVEDRASVYSKESTSVASDVREWCLERGKRESHRIVLAGYFEEHESLLGHEWTVHKWKTAGGYGATGNGQGKINRGREALFFSPHCKKMERQGLLFE